MTGQNPTLDAPSEQPSAHPMPANRTAAHSPAEGIMTNTHRPRVVVYHQSHGHGETFVPLAPMIESGNLTHLIISAVHINDDKTVTLNDHPHDDPYHDQLWAEAADVAAAGVSVMVMVGGWAPGTMEKLDGEQFDTYYPAFRDFLRVHNIQGVDIDVEQDMSLEGVVRLIDALRADFGGDFDIILAPVASAMWGGENLSGFDYEELYRLRGDEIDWVQIQFYSGFGSLEDTRDVERIIERGVYPVDKLVLGAIGDPADGSGFVEIDRLCATLSEVAAKYPTIGGVDVWEYFNALPGGREKPWLWIDRVHEALVAGADRVNALGLIPTPASVVLGDGALALPATPGVVGSDDAIAALADALGYGTGLRLAPAADGLIRLVDDADVAEGGYRLAVDAGGVEIRFSGRDGLLAGAHTLRQLLPAWASGPAPLPGAALEVPHIVVEDAPRFKWRGIMLDVARHFQPLPFLYRFIDQLAALKLNVLHLHLTDDQGWRFEVKGYPKLVRIGSWRTETHAPAWENSDGQPHGGYYTQDQLRALVAYAEHRGVTIVPEVDLPGHVRALLAAYPQYGDPAATERKPVATTFGVFDEVLHLTPSTMEMVHEIFTQLLDVFPSHRIHIGGDECPKTQWQGSEAAKELAAELGLGSVDELQNWFTDHMRDWLAERGRQAVAWDEVIEGHDSPGTLIMSWRGWSPGIEAVKRGMDAVMTTWHFTYLDHYQSEDPAEPYAIGAFTSWQRLLGYDPMMDIPDGPGNILGIQAQLWSEYMPNPQHVEYMAFPRAASLAEIGWATTRATDEDFFARLVQQGRRWDAAGINHRSVGGAKPWQQGGTGLRRRPADHGGPDSTTGGPGHEGGH